MGRGGPFLSHPQTQRADARRSGAPDLLTRSRRTLVECGDSHPANLSFEWRRPGSNRQPPACKTGALPIELRPQSRGTCRFSLTPGLGVLGFEPRTSALSELRSSQLSYTPRRAPVANTPGSPPNKKAKPFKVWLYPAQRLDRASTSLVLANKTVDHKYEPWRNDFDDFPMGTCVCCVIIGRPQILSTRIFHSAERSSHPCSAVRCRLPL